MGSQNPLSTTAQPRQGERQVLHTRSDRFFREGRDWFFTTREGAKMGPYADKAEAQLALAYFVERTQWPDPKQLRQFIRSRAAYGDPSPA